ncbi:hypothetical protein GH733_016400 [Mirounga leonina]|nr:hypothetical protein GH733_016400 [Mirounga leonina]
MSSHQQKQPCTTPPQLQQQQVKQPCQPPPQEQCALKTKEPCHPKAPEPCHPKAPEPCHPKAPEPCHPKAPEPCHPKVPEPCLPTVTPAPAQQKTKQKPLLENLAFTNLCDHTTYLFGTQNSTAHANFHPAWHSQPTKTATTLDNSSADCYGQDHSILLAAASTTIAALPAPENDSKQLKLARCDMFLGHSLEPGQRKLTPGKGDEEHWWWNDGTAEELRGPPPCGEVLGQVQNQLVDELNLRCSDYFWERNLNAQEYMNLTLWPSYKIQILPAFPPASPGKRSLPPSRFLTLEGSMAHSHLAPRSQPVTTSTTGTCLLQDTDGSVTHPRMSFNEQQCKQPCVPPPCLQKAQEQCQAKAEEVCLPPCQDPCQEKCSVQVQEVYETELPQIFPLVHLGIVFHLHMESVQLMPGDVSEQLGQVQPPQELCRYIEVFPPPPPRHPLGTDNPARL